MEAAGASPVGNDAPDGLRVRLMRGPLFWAALAAFVGSGVGFFGTVRQAALWDSYSVGPLMQLLAEVLGFGGEALAMVALFGVAYLLWTSLRRAMRLLTVVATASLALLLAVEATAIAVSIYYSTGGRWEDGYTEFPIPGLEVMTFYAIVFLPPGVLLLFALVSLLGREWRLGAVISVLAVLAVPFGYLRFMLFPPDPQTYVGPSNEYLMFLMGWFAAGVSMLEVPLWVLLGAMFWRRARACALGEAFRARERENLKLARRLYEEGLARSDASVLDDLVSEDFRDVRRGSRGRLAMERVFSSLWRSYPDLSVGIEGQETEGDVVRTRLLLSGTDRGGVLWYPPTGRRAAFAAEFVDRFSDGRLVEHSGEADTEGLLRQLGLSESHAIPHRDAGG